MTAAAAGSRPAAVECEKGAGISAELNPAAVDPGSRYRVAEKLPSFSAHSYRYRVFDQTFGREAELRVGRGDKHAELHRVFLLEMRELAGIDHPAFLPVLDRGTLQGRPFYVVPLRTDPRLTQLVDEGTLTTEQRLGVTSFLITALVQAHERKTIASWIDAQFVALTREHGLPYFVHHRVDPDVRKLLAEAAEKAPDPEAAALDRLPEDCELSAEPSVQANLFLWGRLAYWLLSRGRWPYPQKRTSGPTRKPTADLNPKIPRAVGEVVDACLDWAPAGRPESAAEVYEVLKGLGHSGPLGVGAPKPDNSGLIMTDSVEFSREALNELVGSSARVEAAIRPTDDNPAGAERRRKGRRQDDPVSPEPSGGWGRTVGTLALLAGLFYAGFALAPVPGGAGSQPATPRAATRKPPATRPPRERKAPPPAGQAELLALVKNARVRLLLEGGLTTEANFRGRLRSLHRLASRGQLPADMDGKRRLDEIAEAYKKDARGGISELDAFVRSLQRRIDEAKRKAAEGAGGGSP